MNQPPRALPADFSADLVRMSLEGEILRRFAAPDSPAARLGGSPPDIDTIRRELLASAMRLSETMAPELYASAREAARTLGVTAPIEIYQAEGPENAAVHLLESPVVLEAQGRLLALLDAGCAQALFGHELGHFLLHGPRHPGAALSMKLIGLLRRGGVPDELGSEIRALSMAQELSADRFGLLACQDVEACLRLEMICTTGLSARTLTWDTQAYLAQSKELTERILQSGDVSRGTTHPEHSVRAYGLWLFSETAEYRRITGKGPGTRALAEVDALLARVLRKTQADDGPLDIYEPIPREVHQCALAAAVVVASADGEIAERELEVIERAFDGLVPDWRDYLDREVALRRLFESSIVVTALGEGSLRAVFTVLVHVMLADEVVTPEEVEAILAVADLLQARPLFTTLLAPSLQSHNVTLDVQAMVVKPIPKPVAAHEAEAALSAFLSNASARGTRVTPRRLLRLAGHRTADAGAVRAIQAHIERAALRPEPALSFDDLDAAITLTPTKALKPKAADAPLSADRAALRRAIGKLRDELVSGDGRSPSVRLREARSGRVVDLAKLDLVSTGLAERTLTQIHAQKRAPLFEAALESRLPEAKRLAGSLIALAREHRSRLEETGADDLFVGYPLLAGAIDGYVVRGPLVLHPTTLVFESRGARVYTLEPKDDPPFVNQSLLRLIFHKRKAALTESLLEELDKIAGEPGDTTEALLGRLAEAGVACARPHGELVPLVEDLAQLEQARNVFRIEESLVLGLFPQSSSALLQEYDATLAKIDDPGVNMEQLLGAASHLLPSRLRAEVAPPKHVAVPLRPAIFADPSQREVVLRARSAPALVVDGPPGTGKSQVIANLITDAIARGERVAVVCEKRAALDVVVQRLDQLGLRPLMGLVHDVYDDRRALLAQVAGRLEKRTDIRLDAQALARTEASADACAEGLRRRAQALRTRLRDGGHTLGELHGVSASFVVPTLAEAPSLTHLDGEAVQAVAQSVTELLAYADVLGPHSEVRRTFGSVGRTSFARLGGTELRHIADRLLVATEAAARAEQLDRGEPSIESVGRAASALSVAAQCATYVATPPTRGLFGRAAALLRASPEQYARMHTRVAELPALAPQALALPVPVRFETPPAVAASLAILGTLATRFWRFLSPAWWRARKAVLQALPRIAPEISQASMNGEFVATLQRRVEAAAAWKAMDGVLEELRATEWAPLGPRELPGRVQELVQATSLVAQLHDHRPVLQSVDAWPDGDFEHWQATIGKHQARLAAHARLDEAHRALQGTFQSLPRTATSQGLRRLHALVLQAGQRMAHADLALERAAHAALGEASVPAQQCVLQLADSLGDTAPGAAAHRIYKTWAEQCIATIEAGLPDARALHEHAEAERTEALRLGQLEDERSLHATACVWEASERADVLSVDPPAKHARRTASQSVREDMLKEAKKQRNILTLRQFAQRFANRGLLDVIPVWLLSPETMVTMFPAEPLFDLVIFDEASQCTVANGFPVLSRAKRFVVAGDDKQMPPSAFFSSRAETDDEAEEDEAKKADRSMFDEESLLTLAAARIERRSLSWHYRCRQESLIAFSNNAFYEGNLQTIPSPHGPASPPAIRWVQVQGGAYLEGSNPVEAERVVDVVEALLHRADKPTIGVVTFNLKQRSTILDCIDARRAASETFAAAWDAAAAHPDLDQRPFVKNLEQVQGDERDVIVFSLGHAEQKRRLKSGVTESYVPARFGPLGQRGGERRLNVAVSRAKQETHVVASFAPHLLQTAKAKNRGPRLFKSYLEFARHSSEGAHAQARRTLEGLSERAVTATGYKRSPIPGTLPLAAQIAAALDARGVRFERDIGASGFRVSVAVYAADDPTRFRLAVLADEGADQADVFETHVHRPRVLEQRGWKVLRVTAAEWSRQAEAVVGRIVRAIGG
jgi:AAA domain/REase_MTES_1575/Protein of unknown function (DUF4011)